MCSSANNNASCGRGSGFVLVIVLYILLAIILGSRLYNATLRFDMVQMI